MKKIINVDMVEEFSVDTRGVLLSEEVKQNTVTVADNNFSIKGTGIIKNDYKSTILEVVIQVMPGESVKFDELKISKIIEKPHWTGDCRK